MLDMYGKTAAADRFEGESAESLTEWQTEKRVLLERLIGLDKLATYSEGQKTDLSETNEELLEDGIRRTHCLFRVDDHTIMPLYLLTPDCESKGTFLALAGHQGGGKYSVAGVKDIGIVADRIGFFNYDYGYKLCKLGYTVICPDPRGFGERRDNVLQGDEDDKFIQGSCRNVSNMAISLGLSVIGLLTYGCIRLIDHLEQSGRFDISKIGCLGFSGGGMQTLYLAALDERIRQAYISGYMYGFRDSLLILNNNCSCNYVPGLWEHFDMGDIACMIAPRPLFIQSCSEDHLNGPGGMTNVYEQMDIIKKAYELYGKEEHLVHDIRQGGHHFHDEPIAEITTRFDTILSM